MPVQLLPVPLVPKLTPVISLVTEPKEVPVSVSKGGEVAEPTLGLELLTVAALLVVQTTELKVPA
jgi:hypothetical protein